MGISRIANRLQGVRDLRRLCGDGLIDDVITDKADLLMLDVDHEGRLCRPENPPHLIEMYGGGPVGLGTLSVNI